MMKGKCICLYKGNDKKMPPSSSGPSESCPQNHVESEVPAFVWVAQSAVSSAIPRILECHRGSMRSLRPIFVIVTDGSSTPFRHSKFIMRPSFIASRSWRYRRNRPLPSHGCVASTAPRSRRASRSFKLRRSPSTHFCHTSFQSTRLDSVDSASFRLTRSVLHRRVQAAKASPSFSFNFARSAAPQAPLLSFFI